MFPQLSKTEAYAIIALVFLSGAAYTVKQYVVNTVREAWAFAKEK